jgi:predicted MFS family arabinose efflux permease
LPRFAAAVGPLRRTTAPFYALVLVTEIVWMAIVPLAPSFAERLSLSKLELGIVLASAGIATLVVSFPVGLLADRIGTRALTIGSAGLVAVSSLGQGLAWDFWSLLSARVAFGVALGTIWTAGLAWRSEDGRRDGGPSALGASVTAAGVGIMLGPAFAGLTAHAFGLRAPFLALAGLSAAVTVLLAGSAPDRSPRSRQPVGKTLRAVGRNRILVGSAAVMVLLGVSGGAVNLLVPLQLRSDGFSAATTGLALTASSALFVLFSALVTRRGSRAVSLRVVGLAAVLYAAAFLLVVLGTSAGATVAFLLARSPFWAAISTLSYPLGAVGARRAGIGAASVMGLLNLVWGAAGAVGPIAAAATAQASSEQVAFLALMVFVGATGLWLLALDRRRREGRRVRSARREAVVVESAG